MNEPKRWIEEGPPPAVERLLQAAEAEQPSDGSLRRVLSGVGIGLGATSAAASAGAAVTAGSSAALATGKGAVLVGAWTKWVVLSVAAVGAGTAAVHRASGPTEKPSTAVSTVTLARPAPATAVEPVVAATVAPAPEPVDEAPPPAARVKSAAPSPKPATAPEVEAPLDAERLAEEVRAVDRARSALAEGRAAETLSALDEYDARFAGRKFAPEALYLRMQALLSLGRKADARSTAERLVRAFPKSPHTARARRVLSETNP